MDELTKTELLINELSNSNVNILRLRGLCSDNPNVRMCTCFFYYRIYSDTFVEGNRRKQPSCSHMVIADAEQAMFIGYAQRDKYSGQLE